MGKIAKKVQERMRNWCGHNYDEKRRPLPRKKGDGNGSTITRGAREEGLREDGWIE